MSNPRGGTICLDFDGVLNSYTSGWTGLTDLPDTPVLGAQDFCKALIDAGYYVVILSTRFTPRKPGDDPAFEADTLVGVKTVQAWLEKYNFPKELKLVTNKPPALLYIDDRGFRFEGSFSAVFEFLKVYPRPGSWVQTIVLNRSTI